VYQYCEGKVKSIRQLEGEIYHETALSFSKQLTEFIIQRTFCIMGQRLNIYSKLKEYSWKRREIDVLNEQKFSYEYYTRSQYELTMDKLK